MIRVLVVDDHAFVRASLVALLGAAGDIDVVGAGSDGDQVPALAAATDPHVVVMDLRMPGVTGTEATAALARSHPSARVLVLTGATDTRTMAEAASAGAAGYLYKGGDPGTVVEGVRTVAAGGSLWPADRAGRRRY